MAPDPAAPAASGPAALSPRARWLAWAWVIALVGLYLAVREAGLELLH